MFEVRVLGGGSGRARLLILPPSEEYATDIGVELAEGFCSAAQLGGRVCNAVNSLALDLAVLMLRDERLLRKLLGIVLDAIRDYTDVYTHEFTRIGGRPALIVEIDARPLAETWDDVDPDDPETTAEAIEDVLKEDDEIWDMLSRMLEEAVARAIEEGSGRIRDIYEELARM